MSYVVVHDFERIVVFRVGRLSPKNPRGPGMVLIWPCWDEYKTVDMRTVSVNVPSQEVLSKDSVTVLVDAVVFYKVVNPVKALTNVEDYSGSTQFLAASTLRNVLGTHDLASLLSEREAIAHMMQSSLEVATHEWGMEVERVEITDIRLPASLQKAMATEAEAMREAKAKVIAAEGEIKASKALAEAANVLSREPASIQLRYLQSLATVSSSNTTTVIFPFPLDVVRGFMR